MARLGSVLVRTLVLLLAPGALLPAAAQQVITNPQETIAVIRGQTALVVQPVVLERLSIADPEVAEVFAVSPREIMVNGKRIGSTSLVLWDARGTRRLFTVQVRPDTVALQRAVSELYPAEQVRISTRGGSVILSGPVSSAAVARQLVEIARADSIGVINNLQAPATPQILLQVRFAEVSRSALRQLGTQINAVRFDAGGGIGGEQTQVETSSAEGLLRLSLFEPDVQIDAVITALQNQGVFRSLAEPNLMARDGEEASFLAGGEFPFPVVQGGAGLSTVTVVWKEFGVRLRFRPTLLDDGLIRLAIAPEVSTLDFSTGLRLNGFQVPSLLTRRADTQVELREGQYLAIAGLMDNSITRNVGRIPLLGDIPVLGELFRSRENRQARTELLVLVSPVLVQPQDAPPPLPTGEPESWQWTRPLELPTRPRR